MTGFIAIVQAVTPLLLGQLWKKDDLLLAGQNPWFAYAWKAMQAGGMVAYGLQAALFIGSFIFDLHFFERLGFVMTWVTHGFMLSYLSITTVFAYFCTSLYRYKTSPYESKKEIRITTSVYLLTEVGLFLLSSYFLRDTVMYLVAGELKDLCETYGAFCSEMGILKTSDAGDHF